MPVHILYGKDTFSRKEALDALKAAIDTDGSLATNTATFDAARSTPQEIMAACDTVPFLAEHRLVIVEGLMGSVGRKVGGRPASPSGGRASGQAPEPDADGDRAEESTPDAGRWKPLVEYVDRMPPSTVLVLLDGEVAKSNPLLKALGPSGKVEHFPAPGERDAAGWIMARARKTGVKIDARAARLLAELIGPDLWILTSEMDKLRAYAGDELIREADVRELVTRAKEQKGYFLADAVVEGQGANAARVLQELIEDGAVLAIILSTIAGRYRRLAIVREMLAAGASGSAIAQRLGIKSATRLIEQAENHSFEAIRRAYERLVQAELDVKRGEMEEQLALELAVQELASRRATAGVR